MPEVDPGERDRLFRLAYRMLGRAGDAEDAVQETFLRWAAADQETIENPAAWLTTVCTRVCLDTLRSARWQREHYVGPWLPEPVLTAEEPDDPVLLAESVSMAFLVVLESLSPLERVAFVLHDIFGHSYEEVAATLQRSPAAVRQLASRARRHLADRPPRFEPDASRRAAVADAFLDACLGADLDRLLELLAPEVTFVADSGGVVAAPRQPVVGAGRVARLLLGLAGQVPAGTELRRVEVNGMPGIVAVVHHRVDTVISLDVVAGRITAVRVVRSPEKLRALAGKIFPKPE
jgi:RNA polymerase sigma-70 factor (ECF subfamily)